MAKKDYDNWTKSELTEEIRNLRKRKKYGMVWEETTEDVVEQCKSELPILQEVKAKEVGGSDNSGADTNILIEGDNYHALSVLNYTHKGKVDVIYIDPPYNTGASDWKYNNAYVDENDTFRHSKWLSMMSKRLQLAKNLLSKNGFFIVSIDHYELFTLGLLCDEIFGESNRIGIIAVVHKPEGRNQAKFFGNSHEYMFFYAKDKSTANFRNVVLHDSGEDRFTYSDDRGSYRLKNFIRLTDGKYSLRENKPHFYYPVYVSPDLTHITLEEREGYHTVFPITERGVERTWKTTPKTLQQRADDGDLIAVQENDRIDIYEKLRESEVLKTHWLDKTYHAYHYGTKLVETILGEKKFDFPKSLNLIVNALKLTAGPKATVLDFFAGSGTTGQAVLELNKQDGGKRKFILSTNNEGDIAEQVCYPRIKNVMTGYSFTGTDRSTLFEQPLTVRSLSEMDAILGIIDNIKNKREDAFDDFEVAIDDSTLRLYGLKQSDGKKVGLGGRMKYFKTTFVPAEPTDRNKVRLTKKATEMLCVKEATFELVQSNDSFSIYRDGSRYTGIIFDHLAIDDFKNKIRPIEGSFSVYVFSLGDDTFDEEFDDIAAKVKLSPIPEAILRVYRRIFK